MVRAAHQRHRRRRLATLSTTIPKLGRLSGHRAPIEREEERKREGGRFVVDAARHITTAVRREMRRRRNARSEI